MGESTITEGAARAPAAPEGRDLAARLEALSERLATCVRPAELPEIEAQVLALLPRIARAAPEGAVSGEQLLVSELSQWARVLERAGLEHEARSARRLLAELFTVEAGAWKEHGEALPPDAEACFEHLSRAYELEREALVRRELEGTERLLRGGRGPVRERLLEALAAQPATDEQRRRWCVDLVDRANDTLTSIDELPPELAAEVLTITRDDIAWHLAHVETEAGDVRGRLRSKWRRLCAEHQERRLQARLERRFGTPWVARWERLILGAILIVVGLLAVEAFVGVSPSTAAVLLWLDTAACALFLWDFAVKWSFVGLRFDWFRRHFLIDLLPSVPYGLLGAASMDPARLGRLGRVFRLVRFTRYVRLLLPFIHIARAVGFLARGLDRMVRRHGHLLNHTIVLHPTPEERARAEARAASPWRRVFVLRGQLARRFEQELADADADPDERRALARARQEVFERAVSEGTIAQVGGDAARRGYSQVVLADELLLRGLEATPEELEVELGPDFIRSAARAVRLFAHAPLRFLPGVAGWVPRLLPDLDDARVVTLAAQHAARRLRRSLTRLEWLADLYGTVTPSELVDRVGSTLVRHTARPASRLILIGGVYLLVHGLLELTGLDVLRDLAHALARSVGTTLVLLGSVCLFFLALGWWMRRLASRATEYYQQVASAQFLHLLDSAHERTLERDAELLERRVFAPESHVRPELAALDPAERRRLFHESVARRRVPSLSSRGFDPLTCAVLLRRDAGDGALLTGTDTRTCGQLLGNLSLVQLRKASWRTGPAFEKRLLALDITQQRSLLGGPFLWHSFLAQALGQGSARHIVEYNRCCIPRAQLPAATAEELAMREAWLARGPGEPADEERAQDVPNTTYFNALHFLDDDEERDQEVERLFGAEVLARLRADRRALFQKVFGSWPLHTLPRDRRIYNPRQSYSRRIEGGRVFFLPLWMARRSFQHFVRGVRVVGQAIAEVRRPGCWPPELPGALGDFDDARRKLDRVRLPLARACTELRAMCDAEYLGLAPPGMEAPPHAELDGDLHLFPRDPDWERAQRTERERAAADMERLERWVERELLPAMRSAPNLPDTLDREHGRALGVAYRMDLRGLRSLVSAQELLAEALSKCTDVESARPLLPSRLSLVARRFLAAEGVTDARRRTAFLGLLPGTDGALGRALEVWHRHGFEGARERGLAVALEWLRQPERLHEPLVTLRIVQTQALSDLVDYRNHVRRLGCFTRTTPDDWA